MDWDQRGDNHSLPISMYSAQGVLRQDPGRPAQWLAEAEWQRLGAANASQASLFSAPVRGFGLIFVTSDRS